MTYDPLAAFDAEIMQFLESSGVNSETVQLMTPADREFGERATNVAFLLARERRQNPKLIAGEIASRFDAARYTYLSSVEPAGNGFINFRMNYKSFIPYAIQSIRDAGSLYGRTPDLIPRQVVVEHTSVNPNKEWHIGHVRNAVLGDVLGRVLRREGHSIEIQNYIDDTGLQAAQAVLGATEFPEPRGPEEKTDHYVGRSYVKVSAELAAEKELRERLREVEEGPAVAREEASADELQSIVARLENVDRLKRRVFEVMHGLERGEHAEVVRAVLGAQLQTAYRLGVFYDLLNWESHLVASKIFDQAMAILRKSPQVYRPKEGRYSGALIIETGTETGASGETKAEVLIRSSGLPTYVAKDIAYHMWKFAVVPDRLAYEEFAVQPNGQTLWTTALHGEKRATNPPDRVINVIAVNQSLAQEAVKEALRVGGFPEAAEKLVHLAYGLVSTARGRISGRKGTSVSGDSVIDEAVRVAFDRVREKRSQDLTEEEMRSIAQAVGVGALRYFMVQYNPMRDIVFDVSDVVSYDGNTGLYIQYALVRMYAILRRAAEARISDAEIDAADSSLLQHEQERRLIYHLVQYPDTISDAGRTLAVNLVAEYAFDLATIFSQFYRDCSVLSADPIELRNARLLLVRTVRDVLANASEVLGLPVIERL